MMSIKLDSIFRGWNIHIFINIRKKSCSFSVTGIVLSRKNVHLALVAVLNHFIKILLLKTINLEFFSFSVLKLIQNLFTTVLNLEINVLKELSYNSAMLYLELQTCLMINSLSFYMTYDVLLIYHRIICVNNRTI